MILKTMAGILIAIVGMFMIAGLMEGTGKLLGADDKHAGVLGMFVWFIIGFFIVLGIFIRHLIWGI